MCVLHVHVIAECGPIKPIEPYRNSFGAAQLGFLASLIGEKVTGFGPLKQFGIETGIPLGQARGPSACMSIGCMHGLIECTCAAVGLRAVPVAV